MITFRKQIMDKLTDRTLQRIIKAPKPTPVAAALAVVKELDGMALNFDEIAEILNTAEPGLERRYRTTDFKINEIRKHPDMRIVNTPKETFVRYNMPLRPSD